MGIFDSIGNMFHSLLNPQEGYKHAEQPLNEGFQQAQNYEAPYAQLGQQQYPQIQAMIQKLLNPAQLENQWSQGYQTSPYAKRALQANQGAGLDAASAMGLEGSSAALGNIQQGAGDIMQKDRQQYMNDLMQKFLTGLGLTSGIYDTGAGISQHLGGLATQHGENLAGLKYGEANAPGSMFANLLKTAAEAYGGGGAGGAGGAGAFAGSNAGASGGFAGNTNMFNR